MSLIYNIFFLIGMNKKVKLHVKNNYFKSFNSDNIFIRLVCLLFILAALIICLYLLYRAISNALYMYRLKTDFYKLRDMGINVKNYNILYFEEFKKKHIMNFSKLKNSKHTEFKNKNGIGMITDKYVVLDFDTKKGIENADFLIEKIPKDTVCEKTPNGYHYYFENDTGKPVYTYIQLVINDIKYSIDVLGVDNLVITSPTNVNGKDYYWINSIYTHKAAKLSENTWILDFIENGKNKPFHRKFNNINLSLNIKNAFIVIDDLNIENNIRFTLGMMLEYSRKIKLLNGVIYVYDDNFYFLTRGSFSKYKNKKTLIEKLKNIITELKPSCIVDLSIIYSNYLKSENIFQITSAVIHNDFKNYKNDREFPNYIETTNIYKKTKYLIKDTITITNYDTTKATAITKETTTDAIQNTFRKNNVNKILTGNESIYIAILLSNYFNILCITLGVISSHSDDPEESSKSLNQASHKMINTIFSLF